MNMLIFKAWVGSWCMNASPILFGRSGVWVEFNDVEVSNAAECQLQEEERIVCIAKYPIINLYLNNKLGTCLAWWTQFGLTQDSQEGIIQILICFCPFICIWREVLFKPKHNSKTLWISLHFSPLEILCSKVL